MAVIKVGCTTAGNVKEYIGLSTDTKPTECGPGSTIIEVDTGNVFIFDGLQWWPL